uniref:UPAR/Ly6 domain-containing protein n=1 Tax=Microcebus murinus TaxID=30608 RepID=A0A8C6EJY1_MICMU
MSSALLLALLGVTLTLPGVQALLCQLLRHNSVFNVSALPVQWTAEQEQCGSGEGCQDTLMIIENGPQAMVVISKGCTKGEDHEARVTLHRTGPGLSVVSYTHVCREADLCNDLSNSAPVWAPPLQTGATGGGALRCPACLSTDSCAGDVTEACLSRGSTHCYTSLPLPPPSSGKIFTRLQVQGCMSQPGCNLLNGTRDIGIGPLCDAGQECQETLLPAVPSHPSGDNSALLWSKGCSRAGLRTPRHLHTCGPTGVLMASYTRFCSSNFCNGANSSSVLLKSLPRPAALPRRPAVPSCVNIFGSCSQNSPRITCPNSTAHCYDGRISVKGGGVTTTVGIQGCVAQSSTSLLSHTRNIGVFSVHENKKDNDNYNRNPLLQSGAALTASLAQVLGLGPALALWYGGLCVSH